MRGSSIRLRKLSMRLLPRAVGDQQRLLVGDAHETCRIAARRAVEAVRSAGRHGEERRRFDEGAVVGVDVIDLFDERAAERLVVERFKLRERRHEM